MAVWASTSFAFFDSNNDSYGGYAIMFSTTGDGLACSVATSTLSSVLQIDLSTPQVFTHTSGGVPTLVPGDIPVLEPDPFRDATPPAMTFAEFSASQPEMTAGTVTITSFDYSSIVGTFTATGPDSSTTPASTAMFTGSFEATVCP
jgi:hypothetical protein